MSGDVSLQVLILIPLITGFIGMATNWAAVKMIFLPRRFVGIGRIGWQGVVPARNDQFASESADSVGKVISARELAERLDPREMQSEIAERLDKELPELLHMSFDVIRPGRWDEMAPVARDMVVGQVRSEVLKLATEVFEDVREISDETLDLHALVFELLAGANADRLSDLFQRMGRKELRFIVYYGGIFGLLVGVAQAALYGVLGQWWLMPIIGVLVGLGTNWLALQMIFRPLEERRFLGIIRYQGMFSKRQPEIAAEYADVVANEIFTPSNLIRVLAEGQTGVRIATVLLRRITAAIDEQSPVVAMLTETEVTDQQVREVQVLLVTHLGRRLPEIREDIDEVVHAKLGVAELVRNRIASMSKPEFERLLRGIFEEDELTLIVIGGVLGGLVGLIQAGIVLAQAV